MGITRPRPDGGVIMAENVLKMANYFPPNKLQILVVFVLTLDNSVLNEVNQMHYGIPMG